MTDGALDSLRTALQGAPGNTLLRLALIRRLLDASEQSEALALALDLTPGDVDKPGDRAVISGLLRSAGLSDLADAWAADRPTKGAAGEDATPVTPPSEDTGTEKTATPDAAPNESGAAPDQTTRPGGRVLRLVGGREVEDGDVPDLPDPQPDQTLTFTDVGGLDEVKKDIHRRIILPFAQPNLVQRFRKRVGGGVLVYGPPGCGKTLLARATAGECGARFVAAHLSEVLDPYIGGSEQRLSHVFRTARGATPAVLFFDEIEALGAKRSTSTSSHIAQLASHFLSEMDGVQTSNDGVLILAATNAPWAMDAAFLRPGRFDRLFFVPPPDRAAREQIFRLELTDRLIADGIDAAALAAATSGRSGADVRAVVERASDAAIDATLEAGEEVPISHRMLMDAIADTRSTVAEWLTTARNHATYSNEGGRYDEILAFLDRHGRRR